ncbi:MAG: signal peptide peptidase SppA [Caldilineaceae bacterium]|nr:signal peptide peptidase SppA [Caldilineaceae bacterium]
MNLLKPIGSAFGFLIRQIGRLWRWLFYGLLNGRRSLLRRKWADYVVFELDGEITERTPARPWYIALLPFTAPPITLESLSTALAAIAADPNVYGVLFLVRNAPISLAQAQSLATLFHRFRAWDAAENGPQRAIEKDVVVFLESSGNASYLMAAAADRILMPPQADWNVLGLHTEPAFLADALHTIGVEADVVRVAPWKTAFDRLSRSEMSEAEREQINRLFDGWFDSMVTAISEGRVLGENQVRSLIDQAPLPAEDALAKTLIDGVAYEDELPGLLGIGEREARLLPYAEARRYLKHKPRATHRQQIGVISLSGTVTSGKSRQFPAALPILGDSTIGSSSVQQLVRAAITDDSLAAVVLHIDSGGGSALASDLMWRELSLLARKKPLVAYLGDVAASGGYYIALPAHKIVCQPATLTGSIGVITAKLITKDAYHKLAVNRVSLRRGKNADLYTDSRPWRGEQRDKIEDSVASSYETFKERVCAGRHLPSQRMEELAGGRVWTGSQAVENGLVDVLGDFGAAVEEACRLAELPTDGTVLTVAVETERPRMPLSTREMDLPGQPLSLAELADFAFAVLGRDWSGLLGQDRIWLLADGLPRLK